MGRTELLASGRLGRQVQVNRSNRGVFVDSQGKRVCCHGERAGTIQGFIQAERDGQTNVRYPSTCDCANVDGLLSNAPSPNWDVSDLSLFELLVNLGAEETVTNGRPQRKALGDGADEIWVQPAGTIVCKHGNTRISSKDFAEDQTGLGRRL